MNIVFISEYATRELYVIEKVIQHYPSAVVIRPSYPAGKKSPAALFENFSLNKFREWTDALTWKLHRELWNRKFYPDNRFPEIPNIIGIPSPDLKKPAGIKAVRELSPDVLITCRAPLLDPELFEVPRTAAVNIHYGLAPWYRGNDTLFWSLYKNDFERLGGCIHHLTEGIDTGNLVAEVYPALDPLDGEIAVDYKTSRLLAEALLKFLKAAKKNGGDLSGKPQKEKGRNFKSGERTLDKSMKYLLKRAVGLARPPYRRESIVTYF